MDTSIQTPVKLKWPFLAIIIACLTIYVLFRANAATIIALVTPVFPSSDEHTPAYYADMIHLVFNEFVWLSIFFAATLFWIRHGNVQQTFTTIEARLLKNTTVTVLIILAIFLAFSSLVAVAALDQFPNSADEYAYLFQAETISQGKLWYPVHEQHEFFDFHHLIQKENKWLSRFPPGWPLILSIAYLLHIPPFIVNVIIGALSLIVFYVLVKRLYDLRTAIWSLLGISVTSFYIFQAASYFSHSVFVLETLLFVYFLYRSFDNARITAPLLAGLFLGLMVATRPYAAVLISAPFLLYKIYLHRIGAFTVCIFIAIGALPSLAFLFWYNYSITGNPLVPVTVWGYADESLGFVKGHSFAKAFKHIFKRALMFIYWASPHLLILYATFLWNQRKDLKETLRSPDHYIFLLLVVGYIFYYEMGGNQYGPRFYFDGFPFLVVFVTLKALRHKENWARAVLLSGVVFCILKIPFIAHREHRVIQERKDLYELVAKQDLRNAVVLIASPTGIIRPMPEGNLARNDGAYSGEVLYAQDNGEGNVELFDFYKDRNFYRYTRKEDVKQGELVQIVRQPL
jgi:hypothetical protein